RPLRPTKGGLGDLVSSWVDGLRALERGGDALPAGVGQRDVDVLLATGETLEQARVDLDAAHEDQSIEDQRDALQRPRLSGLLEGVPLDGLASEEYAVRPLAREPGRVRIGERRRERPAMT